MIIELVMLYGVNTPDIFKLIVAAVGVNKVIAERLQKSVPLEKIQGRGMYPAVISAVPFI
jgi:hypothetical protein